MPELTEDQAGDEGQEQDLEPKYAYYRRCSRVRKNGERCKGPAMKGETLCYGHFNEAELARIRERQRRELLGPALAQPGNALEVNRALERIGAALMQGYIDPKTAGNLIVEIRDRLPR